MSKNEFWRYVPVRVDPKKGLVYEEQLLYIFAETEADELPFVPAIILGGERVESLEGYEFYQSFFDSYVAYGDLTILNFSDNQGVNVRSNFPIKSVKGQKCSVCRGVRRISDGTKQVTCTGCNGLSVVPAESPYGVHIKEPPSTSENEKFALAPSVEWYHPDISILEQSSKTWREFLQDAKDAANLNHVDEAQSGIAKEIDREQKNDQRAKIADNLFKNIIQKSLDLIEAIRVPTASQRQENIVISPTNFQIITLDQVIEEISQLKEKGLPAVFIIKSAQTLANKLYKNDAIGAKIVQDLIQYDVLFPYSIAEVLSLSGISGFDRDQLARHIQGYQLIKEISTESGYLEMKFEKVKELADGKLITPPESTRDIIEAIRNKANEPVNGQV